MSLKIIHKITVETTLSETLHHESQDYNWQ